MASEVDAAQDWVILAGFQNGRAAEHMVASLGRGFRQKHRKGHAEALVVTANKDGSLKITQSRALSASGFLYTVMRIGLSVLIGFLGMLGALRGAKGSVKEARHRGAHVGADDRRAHELLGGIGPDAGSGLRHGDSFSKFRLPYPSRIVNSVYFKCPPVHRCRRPLSSERCCAFPRTRSIGGLSEN